MHYTHLTQRTCAHCSRVCAVPRSSTMASAVSLHVRSLLRSGSSGGSVLGLDVSSRCTGLAQVSSTGELVGCAALTARPGAHAFAMAAAVGMAAHEANASMRVTGVAVEAAMKAFSPGAFSTRHIFKLAALNGAVAHEAWRACGAGAAAVDVAMPNAVRAALGVASGCAGAAAQPAADLTVPVAPLPGGGELRARLRASGDEETKLTVLRFVTRIFPDLAETWALTRTGTLAKANFDRADAVLMALWGLARQIERAALADTALLHAFAADGPALRAAAAAASSAAGGTLKRRRAISAAANLDDVAEKAAIAAAVATSAAAAAPLDDARWASLLRLHERSMADEALALGLDTGAVAAAAAGEKIGVSGEDSSAEANDDDEDSRASPRRKQAPLRGLLPSDAAGLMLRYGSLRASFRAVSLRAFADELHSRHVVVTRDRSQILGGST